MINDKLSVIWADCCSKLCLFLHLCCCACDRGTSKDMDTSGSDQEGLLPKPLKEVYAISGMGSERIGAAVGTTTRKENADPDSDLVTVTLGLSLDPDTQQPKLLSFHETKSIGEDTKRSQQSKKALLKNARDSRLKPTSKSGKSNQSEESLHRKSRNHIGIQVDIGSKETKKSLMQVYRDVVIIAKAMKKCKDAQKDVRFLVSNTDLMLSKTEASCKELSTKLEDLEDQLHALHKTLENAEANVTMLEQEKLELQNNLQETREKSDLEIAFVKEEKAKVERQLGNGRKAIRDMTKEFDKLSTECLKFKELYLRTKINSGETLSHYMQELIDATHQNKMLLVSKEFKSSPVLSNAAKYMELKKENYRLSEHVEFQSSVQAAQEVLIEDLHEHVDALNQILEAYENSGAEPMFINEAASLAYLRFRKKSPNVKLSKVGQEALATLHKKEKVMFQEEHDKLLKEQMTAQIESGMQPAEKVLPVKKSKKRKAKSKDASQSNPDGDRKDSIMLSMMPESIQSSRAGNSEPEPYSVFSSKSQGPSKLQENTPENSPLPDTSSEPQLKSQNVAKSKKSILKQGKDTRFDGSKSLLKKAASPNSEKKNSVREGTQVPDQAASTSGHSFTAQDQIHIPVDVAKLKNDESPDNLVRIKRTTSKDLRFK